MSDISRDAGIMSGFPIDKKSPLKDIKPKGNAYQYQAFDTISEANQFISWCSNCTDVIGISTDTSTIQTQYIETVRAPHIHTIYTHGSSIKILVEYATRYKTNEEIRKQFDKYLERL